MDTLRTTGHPWRSWTAIAFVLLTLALIQACNSGKSTGPTSNSSLQLKLHRAGGAEIPAGCTGVYSVSGPGVNIQNAALPANGQIAFQGQVGQTYTITVTLSCGGEILTGSAQITLQPGDNTTTIELTVSKVLGVSCSPNPVAPGQNSTCTCNVQSPGAPTFGWTGAAPTSGNQATFGNNTPGSYAVTCSVNGVANGSTTVTVSSPTVPPPPPPPSQTAIVIRNQDGTINLRAIFSGGPQSVPTIDSLPPGQSATRNVQPGTYDVQILFDIDGFLNCTSESITVNSGQTQTRGYREPESCD